MKRFFKPIEKEGSTAAKKPCLSPEKRDRDGDGVEGEKSQKEPSKFLTWNANSFLLRVKNDWSEFSKFVSEFDPDVIAVQEVRMPAAGGKGKPKNPEELSDDTKVLREEKQILTRALSSPPFGNYRVWWSLADSKYAGTALLVKKCFKPQKVYFNLDKLASKHEPDGRVILAEFETFRLLNTYSPNNGWKEEENSFQRRRKWDKRIVEFLNKTSDKPLIWCGDLNVSHEEIDVSHPEFFASAKLNGYVPPNKEDCGQPGFTPSERGRFGAIMKEGRLVDAYRYLHKEQDMESGFSWSGNPIGKYRGKRMRIDYFLVSEQLKDRIVSCKMHGRGIELEGFYGSDHCPVTLELSKPSSVTGQDQVDVIETLLWLYYSDELSEALIDYSSSAASKNDETVVVETTKHETQTQPSTGEAVTKVKSQSVEEGKNDEEVKEDETEVCATVVVETTTHETQTQPSTGEAVAKVKSQCVEEGKNEEEVKEDETEVCATGAPDLAHEDMETDPPTSMETDSPTPMETDLVERFQLPQESLQELFSTHICRIYETQIEK